MWGKSTFINQVARRKTAKAEDRPGVTRGKQWVPVDQSLELLDTPGMLWPRFEDPDVGFRLACTGAVRDEIMDLEELAARCDILSLHCAVNEQTVHMVDEAFLAHVKPGAILVNTARGQLVDNLAVRQALLDGRLGGIAIDTFDPEPTPADHPLVDLPPEIADRAVFSPHLGGITGGVFRRAHRNMWNSVRLLLEGQRPNFIVNGL